jgi:hypothetical protein
VPLLRLDDRWRVAHDGRLQWVLQHRKGDNWYGRRFHSERDPLLRSVAEFVWVDGSGHPRHYPHVAGAIRPRRDFADRSRGGVIARNRR